MKKYTYEWTPGSCSPPHKVLSCNGRYAAACHSERMARKIAKLLNDDVAAKKRSVIDDCMAADLRTVTSAL